MADGKMDETKGRAKEAAGDVTGNKDMKNEGKVDRASGSFKEKVSNVTDKVKGAVKRDK